MQTRVLIRNQEKKEMLAVLDQRLRVELGRLLKAAFPKRERAHQLAKLLKYELDSFDLDTLKRRIASYYAIPFERRTAGQFRKTFGLTPYLWLHSQFILNFSTAHISDTALATLASQLRFYLATSLQPPKPLTEVDFLHLVLHRLVNQRPDQAKASLNITDFIEIWERISHSRWGERFLDFFEGLRKISDFELTAPPTKTPISMGMKAEAPGVEIDLSQSDLDWMKEILNSAEKSIPMPPYPLSRGPKNRFTRQLEKVVRLHNRLSDQPKRGLLRKAASDLCNTYLELYNQRPSSKTRGEVA